MSDQFLILTIAARHQAADGIAVLELVSTDGRQLPRFEPGSHVDVMLEPGLVRQYSLCCDPAQTDRYRLAILLDPATRGGSAALHRLQAGARLRIGLPRNNFPLVQDAAHSLLIGGGIGITPLLAMAHSLHAAGRPFTLHYCAQSRRKAAFLTELASAGYAAQVQLHFDDGPAGGRFDPCSLPEPMTGTHLYVCGPAGFMDWVADSARARGYPEAQLHREYFGAEVDTAGDAFEVVLAKSGGVVPVAAGQSIVSALATVGITVEVSCEQGVCGTCLCDVLEGVPDHRDSYLTADEKGGNDQMLLCCSRAKSPRLVLDL